MRKKQLENIINEQSAIQEEESMVTAGAGAEASGAIHKNAAEMKSFPNNNNEDDTLNAESDAENKQHADNENINDYDSKRDERLQNEDYRCKIIYFFKDCTKVCNCVILVSSYSFAHILFPNKGNS